MMSDIAHTLAHAGISVIPIKPGSKAPTVKWATYQERIADDSELVQMFACGEGIAAVCGPISGGLELMDFDIPGKALGLKTNPPAWKPFCELLKEHGHSDLLKRLIICETPSGGRHLVYRCVGITDGNQKLAETEHRAALIETRGNGGYFLIPPTDGYTLKQGSFENIPFITEAERETLHCAARLQNEHIERVRYERNHPGCQRPGDDYNLRGPELDELLVKHGWRPCKSRGGWRDFTRPDKPDGISGGINAASGMFNCFTTSTAFEPKGYSKFSVYALLEFKGDFFRAAQSLAAEGYGSKREPRSGESHNGPTYETTVPLEDEDDVWTTLDQIEEGAVSWLWNQRIPMDALTLVSGDPGEGKSSLTHALIATFTSGGLLPCGQRVEPCNVVLVSFEDSPGIVLRKRLRLMGADLSRVSILHTEKKDADGVPVFDFGKLTIEMVFRRVKKVGAALLVLDPIVEFIGAAVNMNHANEVRPFMSKLRFNCELHHCAGLLVAHNNKNTGGKALYRTVGSIDFPAACRAVFQVGCDPDDPSHKVFAHVKHNWAQKQPSLSYQVSTVEDTGVFGWTGTSTLTAEDISAPAKPRAEREKSSGCREWLKDLLADGPMHIGIVRTKAKEEGYGRPVLDAAFESLHVERRKSGGRNSSEQAWRWGLPGAFDNEYDPWSDK